MEDLDEFLEGVTVFCSMTDRPLPFAACLAAGVVVLAFSDVATAQLTRGFDKTISASVQNVELANQPDIWMMEVQFKPMRMVFVDLPDLKTGEMKREQVWYLAWRSIVRQVDHRTPDESAPVNVLDSLPGPRQFIPEFTLVTYDDPMLEIPAQILPDDVLPAALEQIQRIERAPHRNSLQVVQNLPEPVASDAEEQPWIYGAATWRGVDPETDFFKVIFGGFTNAYEVRTAEDGTRQIWRKVIVQKFARPGDRFDPTQSEFQFTGDPAWTLQPDPAMETK